MKKVFSKDKFRESMERARYYTKEEIALMCNEPDWWVSKCEGLTEEEMNKNGYVTEDVWMVEVEDDRKTNA